MISFKLVRDVPVKSIDIIARIAVPTQRDDILALLMLAQERGRLTPEVASSKLGVLINREPLAARAIERLVTLGFLDTNGQLTPSGEQAIVAREVMIPERGRYTIYYADDPLLSSPVVGIRAAPEMNTGALVKQGRTQAATVPLPETIRGQVGSRFFALAADVVVELQEIEPVAEASQAPPMKLKLEWTLRDGAAHLLEATGSLNSESFQRTLTPPREVDPLDTFLKFDDEIENDWDWQASALRSNFPDNERERAAFQRDVMVSTPRVRIYGSFEPTIVPGVPIFPRNEREANAWALWAFDQSISA